MTQQEALQEARRRWGIKGRVWKKSFHFYVGFKGYRRLASNGIGDSWEAAFADADQKEVAK